MKRSLPMIFITLVVATVVAAQDDDSKQDQERIQGTWRLVSRERDGKAESEETIKDVVMINDGNKFTFTASTSGSKATKGTFKLDASKKPRAMDRIPADGPQKGKTLPAIYKLEGDKLTLCVSLTGKGRPTQFATKPKSGLLLAVFEREKKDR